MTEMRALIAHRYGAGDHLEVAEVERPEPGEGMVLVKVHAASVNPVDWHTMTGTPYVARLSSGLRRPKSDRVGTDLAGVVVQVGPGVTEWQPGDEVFGVANGALAEQVCAKQASLARKPPNVTFEQAAAVPVAAITALQALRDKGHTTTGTRVLVNGAAGGVGLFAVQIGKALGAEVTGVCSTRNVELVGTAGADRVIDYAAEDFTAGTGGGPYDVLVDNVGNRPLSSCKRLLVPDGVYVVVSGPKSAKLLGPLARVLKAMAVFAVASQRAAPVLAKIGGADLQVLAEMMADGRLVPVVERTYPLEQAPDAFAYLATGHASAKLVVVP